MRTCPCSFAGGTAIALVDDLASRALLNQLEALTAVKADAKSYVASRDMLVLRGRTGADDSPDYNPERLLLDAGIGAGADAGAGCLLHARTRGAPYLLFLATVGNQPVCAYVSRRPGQAGQAGHAGRGGPRVYIDSQVFCDERLFDGTVLAGEMVRGDAFSAPKGPAFAAPNAEPEERWVFLVDDCLASRGAPVSSRPFLERLAAAENAVGLALDQGDGWCSHLVRTKRFFPFGPDGAAAAISLLGERRPYPCTGVLARSLGRRRKDILIAETPRPEAPKQLQGDCGARGDCGASREPLGEVFTIVATGMPDVYVALDGIGTCVGARVSVPTLALSAEMRRAFALTPPGEGVPWTCSKGPGDLLVPLEGGGTPARARADPASSCRS
jgi:hypothetical protein